MTIKKIGILVGGGPAPGLNDAVAAATLHALDLGLTPVGFNDGFEWLAQRYTDEQKELTREDVANIHLDGGCILGTSRTDIARDPVALENTLAALGKLKIDALITIGGDDLVASSIAIEQQSGGAIKVVQIPKSIDNDLALSPQLTTLGYESARHVGVGIVESLMEDSRTTGRWFIAVTMGRPTGHLTLGIGAAASATCTIIPEEFGERLTLGEVGRIIEGSILKRLASGKSHGVALVSEAIVELFSPEELTELQDVDRDAQGRVRVAEIDLGRRIKTEVQSRLEKRGLKVTIVDKTIGYELRCAPPIPIDAEHARDLGYAAVNFLHAGGSGALITMQNGAFSPIPLAEMVDADGRGKLRAVDVRAESYHVARDYMVRIEAKDLNDAELVGKLAAAAKSNVDEIRATFA
ncbi:MAG: 6-phosphofructokinase [Blastocatellia bacterium]|jgi:6-phosphofructokinase 1